MKNQIERREIIWKVGQWGKEGHGEAEGRKVGERGKIQFEKVKNLSFLNMFFLFCNKSGIVYVSFPVVPLISFFSLSFIIKEKT
jgi:hypothetical protein